MNSKTQIEQYMETFTERELRGYAIAKSHLGHSFQLDKSVGYQKWCKEHITHMPPSTEPIPAASAAAAK